VSAQPLTGLCLETAEEWLLPVCYLVVLASLLLAYPYLGILDRAAELLPPMLVLLVIDLWLLTYRTDEQRARADYCGVLLGTACASLACSPLGIPAVALVYFAYRLGLCLYWMRPRQTLGEPPYQCPIAYHQQLDGQFMADILSLAPRAR
jgi:hypothetical protein